MDPDRQRILDELGDSPGERALALAIRAVGEKEKHAHCEKCVLGDALAHMWLQAAGDVTDDELLGKFLGVISRHVIERRDQFVRYVEENSHEETRH